MFLPGTKVAFVYGLVAIAIGAAFLLPNMVRVFRSRFGARLNALYMMGVSLYPLGVGCKFAILGPEFLRFHLSDIGFPLAIGFVILLFRTNGLKSEPSYEHALVVVRYRRTSLLIALTLSYLFEISLGALYTTHRDVKVQMTGNFDPLDMVMYTVGAGFGLVLLEFWRRKIVAEKTVHDAAVKAEQEAKPPARPRRQTHRSRRQSRSQRREKK